jgi:hypothetical protein
MLKASLFTGPLSPSLIGALRVSALSLFHFSPLGVFGHLSTASRLIERQAIVLEPLV